MEGYIGKIKNAGTQKVDAPHQQVKGKTGTVKTGGDIRANKSNK